MASERAAEGDVEGHHVVELVCERVDLGVGHLVRVELLRPLALLGMLPSCIFVFRNAIVSLVVGRHHTCRRTHSKGRGTGFRDKPTCISAAVSTARVLVPNSIDDGDWAFEHEARMLAGLAVVVCHRALSRGGRVVSPQS